MKKWKVEESNYMIVLNVLDILVPSTWQGFPQSKGWKLSLLWKITCIRISLPSPYHRKQTRRIINERGVLCLSWTGCLAQTVGKDAGCRSVLLAELRWAKQHKRRNALAKAKPPDKIQGLCHESLYTFGCLFNVIFCNRDEEKQGKIEKKLRWNNLMWL